jgi:glucokinase
MLAARVLGPGDLALIISPSGRKEELLAIADLAHERGAAVLAITASQSPLARKADVSLIVDHAEDVDLHVPMVSRVLHLLMVDILTVGVALQTQSAASFSASLASDDPAPAPSARTVAPGVSAAAMLAKISSHSH